MKFFKRLFCSGILLALLGCVGSSGNPGAEGIGGARATGDEPGAGSGDFAPKMPDVHSAPVGDPKEDGPEKEDPKDSPHLEDN